MGRGPILERDRAGRGPLSRPEPQLQPAHAVLAFLSESYPPLEGRLPTCYSPVRHFTCPRRNFLVRLACLKPAASVRSEPESNSPIEISRVAGVSPLLTRYQTRYRREPKRRTCLPPSFQRGKSILKKRNFFINLKLEKCQE